MLDVDGEGLEKIWSIAAAGKDLFKFGGGFYVGKLPNARGKVSTSVVPSASDILAELPRSIYGGIDALALPSEFDESEKMLLFPESVVKAAVDTLKEVAIDDFKAEQYERAVKHLTVSCVTTIDAVVTLSIVLVPVTTPLCSPREPMPALLKRR